MNPHTDEELLRLHTSRNADDANGPSELEIESEMIRRGLIPKHAQEKFLVKRLDGSRTGPHDTLEIKSLFNDGAINADSPVHVQSLFGWVPLRNVFEFEKWSEASPATLTAETMPICGFNTLPRDLEEETNSQSDTSATLEEDPAIATLDDPNTSTDSDFKPQERGIRRLTFNLSLLGLSFYQSWARGRWIFLDDSTYIRIGSILLIVLLILRSRNIGLGLIKWGLIPLVPLWWYFTIDLLPVAQDALRPNFGPPNLILMEMVGLIVVLFIYSPLLPFNLIKTNAFGRSKGYIEGSTKSAGLAPIGFGGWLVLFVVSRVVWFPLYLLYRLEVESSVFSIWRFDTVGVDETVLQAFSFWRDRFEIFIFFEGICLLAFGIFASKLLLESKPSAPLMAKTLCVYGAISILGMTIWRYMIGTDLLEMANSLNVTNPEILTLLETFRIPVGMDLMKTLTGLAVSVAWFLYFTYSKRVKATYTRAPEAAETA